jgi:predicted phage baseplate assembly protein
MTTKTCGCTTQTCGCCDGTAILTPVSTFNRPGLDALQYRVGTHGTFFETMKARLASMSIQLPAINGQAPQTLLPLQGLTTRDTSDPAIALLDAWATVGDVLTFYQERIANEGYLRTATERQSVLELARLVGYALRPGVAATVYLAYTLDNNQATPVVIPAGAQSQSIPGPGELPQPFETSDDLEARSDWNDLQVRLTKPQDITLDDALDVQQLYAAGTNTNVKAGDSLLLVFGDNGDPAVLRKVSSVDAQFDTQRTLISFQTFSAKILSEMSALVTFLRAIQNTPGASTKKGKDIVSMIEGWATQVRLGVPPVIRIWLADLHRAETETVPDFLQPYNDFLTAMGAPAVTPPPPPKPTGPSQFVTQLLEPPILQARSSLDLTRSLAEVFQPNTDAQPQVLVTFAPQLKETFYTAWENANVNDTESNLKAVYVFRVQAPLFGASVPLMAAYDPNGKLLTPDKWTEWNLASDESSNTIYLDQAYDGIAPGSLVMIQQATGGNTYRQVMTPTTAQTLQRTAYNSSGKTTELTFADIWLDESTSDTLAFLRPVLVFAQSDPLTLIEEPITVDVKGQEIELDALYSDLKSGRWVILTGERTDIPGVTGVTGTELLMISGLRQGFDQSIAGDTTHTTLLLATNTAYSYKRDQNLTIYCNVVKATNGGTKNETLGDGDGSQALQSFTLKQPPLTFVAAPNPSGVDSTLQVYVNNVQWHEVDTLAGLGPKARAFVTETDDSDNTTVIFGNGEQGARLPTGVQNIVSVYRSGIGQPGNVDAQQISLLQTRPLGVKSVINPLGASGGADRENIDQARGNTPLAVLALDRLVSVEDYASFSRTFAGIGKAASTRISDGRRELVEITIAGADDAPIDTTSDLYQNLLLALVSLGDPALPVQVDLRELVVLTTSVNIKIQPDYQWDPVSQAVRAAMLDAFGFEKRSLGQPALLCELIALIQNVPGVAYLDVDAFSGIPEKVANADGTRRLLTLDEIAKAATGVGIGGLSKSLARSVRGRVNVNQADFENGAVRPAQLAIFTSAVQDTIVLNQII